MRIVCPKCETEYALDAAQLSTDGTPVQCSACEHTFTAYPDGRGIGERDKEPAGDASAAVMAAPEPGGPSTRPSLPPEDSRASAEASRSPGMERAPSAALGRIGDVPARSTDGVMSPHPTGGGGRLFLAQGDRIYKVKDAATLQRWVVEKRVLPNDRLSRDGKSWDVVSSVAELQPFFTVLDQLNQTRKALSRARKVSSSESLVRSQSSPNPSHPSGRQLPPPVLPADRAAHLPPGSESLATEARSVDSRSDDVSAGAATPVGTEDLGTAGVREQNESGASLLPGGTVPRPGSSTKGLEDGESQLPGSVEASAPGAAERVTSPQARVPSGPIASSTPSEVVEAAEEPSPAELPADPPAHLPPDSESLAAEERSVDSRWDDVSAGVATPGETEAFGTAAREETESGDSVLPVGTVPRPGSSMKGVKDEAKQSPDFVEDSRRVASERVTSPQAKAPSGTDASPASSSMASTTSEDVDGDSRFADSLFGDYVQSGETGGVSDPPDVGPSVDSSPNVKETRVFEVPGTVETSDQLPSPESLHIPTSPDREDFDPDQTFGGLRTTRPSEGAGGVFYSVLVLLVALGLVLGWYFLLGPGQTLVFGDPTAGVTPPKDGSPVTASPAKNDPVDGATPDEPEGQAAGDGQAEADPAPAAPDKATSKPPLETTSKPPSKATSKPPPEATSKPPPEATSKPPPEATPKPPPEATPKPPPEATSKPTQTASDFQKVGDRARDRGDFRGAAAAYRDALELSPNDVTLHIELGWSYIELGKNAEATTHFSRATVLAPQRADAHYGLGLAYQSMGSKAQAITEYRKVIELDPNGSDTLEVKALLRQLE